MLHCFFPLVKWACLSSHDNYSPFHPVEKASQLFKCCPDYPLSETPQPLKTPLQVTWSHLFLAVSFCFLKTPVLHMIAIFRFRLFPQFVIKKLKSNSCGEWVGSWTGSTSSCVLCTFLKKPLFSHRKFALLPRGIGSQSTA